MKIIFLFVLLVLPLIAVCQNKHLKVGYKNYGLHLGNSKNNNGIRLNLWDRNVENCNGVNISFKTGSTNSNGFKIGVLSCFDSISNGLSISGLATASERINGIAISGLAVQGMKFNGLGISGLIITGDTLIGVFLSPWGIWSNWNLNCVVNGFLFGGGAYVKKLSGVSVGMVNHMELVNGVSIVLTGNVIDVLNGVEIGAFNKTKKLYGFQVGLWNVAENKKILKKFPLINFNFKRT